MTKLTKEQEEEIRKAWNKKHGTNSKAAFRSAIDWEFCSELPHSYEYEYKCAYITAKGWDK